MYMSVLQSIHELIYPQYCKICQSLLPVNYRIYCNNCLNENITLTQLGNWQTELTHGEFLDEAYSLYWYDEVLHECIHILKYSNSIISIKNIFTITSIPNINADMIIPIPLYHAKQRERGYNQAEVIAHIISEHVKIPVNNSSLKRIAWTDSQTKLNNTQRKENMMNKFSCSDDIYGNVLLVDDVLTTGATANSCAKTLKEYGANKVGVITLATPRIDSQ